MPRRSNGPAPRKSLGQHFLRDSGVLNDIADAVEMPAGGVVIEIGAGTGQLTRVLLERGFPVIAIEIEPRLVRHLRDVFQASANLRIVPGDARALDYAGLVGPGQPFVVAGNLPYFAANPIIRHMLESPRQPDSAILMLQREVAREIAAAPGKSSLLSLSVQVYAEPAILFDVPPEAFDPPPAVHSSVIRLHVRERPLVSRHSRETFFAFVARTFRNPRKQLHNALTRETGLTEDQAVAALRVAGIDGTRRAETLTIDEWMSLIAAAQRVRQ